LTRDWNVRAAISYVLIWCLFLGWCLHDTPADVPRAMWVALNTGRPTFAVFHFQRGAWWYIWMVFNARNLWGGLMVARKFPSGSVLELVTVSCIFVFIAIMAWLSQYYPQHFRWSAEERREYLISDMRSIAREPVPDTRDPRFKNWNGRGRLPEA
jgi:hypothetical protein